MKIRHNSLNQKEEKQLRKCKRLEELISYKEKLKKAKLELVKMLNQIIKILYSKLKISRNKSFLRKIPSKHFK